MLGLYRFILALNVALFHLFDAAAIGPYAVFSFFILSGFLMTLIMHQSYGYSKSGLKKYLINRGLRLFPVYWALLIVTISIVILVGKENAATFHSAMTIPNTISEWLSNIFLMFIGEYPIDVTPRLAPATWALSIELFFYLLIGLGISKTRKLSLLWLSISVLYAIYFNFTEHLGLGYGSLLSASLPFAMGACTYHYKEAIYEMITSSKLQIILVTCFVANLLIATNGHLIVQTSEAWKLGFICRLANLILSLFMTVLLFKHDKALNNTFTRLLGDMSYPVYIFHWAGALLTAYLLNSGYNKPLSIWVFLLGLILTLVISLITDRLIATPVEILRKRIKS